MGVSTVQTLCEQCCNATKRVGSVAAMGLAVAAAIATLPACADEPEVRIYAGLKSSNEIVADLEYIVSKLAKQTTVYVDQVAPNVEIFLLGMNLDQPVRFDPILQADGSYRLSMVVPVADEDEFIRDNVNPIGINTRLVDVKTNLYELTGEVFEGWMRFVDNDAGQKYAVFGEKDHKSDVEKTFPDISAENKRLFFEEFDVAALMDETSGKTEGRERIAEALRKDALAKLQRRPDESDAEFGLRNHLTKSQFDRLESILVGGKRVGFGYSTEVKEEQGRSKLVIEAIPGTSLAKAVDLVGSEPSKFAAVPTIDDPIATGRLAIPVYDERRARFQSLLEMSRPVTLEHVDEDDVSDALKAARKKFINLLYDQFVKGTSQTFMSGFYEVHAVQPGNQDKGNNVAGGITTVEGSNVVAILDAFPAAVEGSSVSKDVEKIGDIAIHKVSVPDLAAEMKRHLGGVTDVYIGVADDAVYFAGGPEGLALLKKSLDGIKPEKTDTAFSLKFHAGPLASLLDSVMTNRDFSLIEFLQDRREDRLTEKKRDPDDARRVQVADPKEWREAALKALEGKTDDVVDIKFHKADGALLGDATYGRAILTAAGELIAKFAEENL